MIAIALLSLYLQTKAVNVPITHATQPVNHVVDDVAVWVNPVDSAQLRIYGTDKHVAPEGAVVVFSLEGKILQRLTGLNRPHDIAVEPQFRKGTLPIAVVAESKAGRLRIFGINKKTGLLRDMTGNTAVAMSGQGGYGEPTGVGLYRRSDGKVFAIVSPKQGLSEGYLEQYELQYNSKTEKIDTQFVRRFGKFSGKKGVVAICVDSELGYVYYNDEIACTRKYKADPDAIDCDKELATLNINGFQGDREGMSLWKRPDGTGYLICTDQRPDNSQFHVLERQGNNREIGIFQCGSDSTDGIAAVTQSAGKFNCGLFIASDAENKRFVIVDWQKIEVALKLHS